MQLSSSRTREPSHEITAEALGMEIVKDFRAVILNSRQKAAASLRSCRRKKNSRGGPHGSERVSSVKLCAKVLLQVCISDF